MVIPVVFSSDHNFVMPTSVALKSMLDCSQDCEVEVYLFQSEDVTDSDRLLLTGIASEYSAKIHYLTMGDEFSGLFEVRGVTVPAYYRLFIPWFIPDHDIVVYADGDVVFNRSIRELVEAASDSTKWVYGVNDSTLVNKQYGIKYIKSLGISPSNYINSGVLVINAGLQRKHNLKEIYKSQLQHSYNYQDQDIINLVCGNHIGMLPGRFNRQSEAEGIDKDTVIFHYTGGKPWKMLTWKWMLWWDWCKKTPCYDIAMENLADKIERSALYPKYSNIELIKKLFENLFPRLYYRLRRSK